MTTPLRIAFPVIDCDPYCINFRGPAILLGYEAITPAHDLRDPNPHGWVFAQLQDGKQIKFTIPLYVWQDAVKNAVLFQSVPKDSVGARTGVLFDSNGQPLKGMTLPIGATDAPVGQAR